MPCRTQSGAIGSTRRTAAYTPLTGATNRIAIPNVACSNQSVTQQCAGTVPHRTRIASSKGMVAQAVGGASRPWISTAVQPRIEQADEEGHVEHVDPRRPAAAGQLDVGRHRRRGQEPDQQPRLLARELRQADGLGRQRPGERESPHLHPRCGQRRQEMDQRDRRHEGRVELVEGEDLAAQQEVLRAQGQSGLRWDAQVESQPGQDRAGHRRAGERQAPVIGADRLPLPAHPQRAEQRDHQGIVQPGELEDIHENSSIVPKWGLTESDSRDAPPERKSVQRRSRRSHHWKARTNGRTTYSSRIVSRYPCSMASR